MKKSLTALYWVASLGIVAGAAILLFGGPDLLKMSAKSDPATTASMPPQPPVPAPAQPERAASITYEGARTSLPMGEITSFFVHKEFLAGDSRRRHTLTYYLYAPAPPYPPGLTFPLVLVLHDVHGKADAAQYLIEGDFPVKHPAFVVVPVLPFAKKWAMPQQFPEMQGFEPLARGREGLRDAVQLVDTLKSSLPIDATRVYTVGCEEGGFGAFAAALRYPDTFAAAVPIGSGWTAQDAKGFSKVPLWVLHGALDNYYASDLSRNAANYINAYGGKASFTEVPGIGHDCTSPQFYRPALWQWLFQQHK